MKHNSATIQTIKFNQTLKYKTVKPLTILCPYIEFIAATGSLASTASTAKCWSNKNTPHTCQCCVFKGAFSVWVCHEAFNVFSCGFISGGRCIWIHWWTTLLTWSKDTTLDFDLLRCASASCSCSSHLLTTHWMHTHDTQHTHTHSWSIVMSADALPDAAQYDGSQSEPWEKNLPSTVFFLLFVNGFIDETLFSVCCVVLCCVFLCALGWHSWHTPFQALDIFKHGTIKTRIPQSL